LLNISSSGFGTNRTSHKGQYRWVAEIVQRVVFADPNNKDAKELLADACAPLSGAGADMARPSRKRRS